MADRYYNRDRNRPYDEDFNEDFYNQDLRSRGRYDRDFDYRRDYEMRNRSYSSGEPEFGGENRFNERNWGDMNRGGYGSSYNRGITGSRDYEYDTDYDRWNRGNYYGGGYGNYGRGSSSYGRNYGSELWFQRHGHRWLYWRLRPRLWIGRYGIWSELRRIPWHEHQPLQQWIRKHGLQQ